MDVDEEVQAGSISYMILKNFMCHSLLEVKFDKNVNFVSGNNGSGKSAILTALVVGLGAKASVTNRGPNVKGFIKAGTKSATVEIGLNNEGSKSYKPKVFGNLIIIERTISLTSSTYKVKTASGKVFSKRSRDVQTITLNLNIQIDNPVCILNQDTARSFLSTNDTKARFTLFNRATRLENLFLEYKEGLSNKEQAKVIFNEKRAALKVLKDETTDLEVRIKQSKNVKELQATLAELQKEILWSKVNETEKELADVKNVLETHKETQRNLQSKSTDRGGELKQIQDVLSDITRRIRELTEASEQNREKTRDSKTKIRNLKLKVEDKERAKGVIEKEIRNLESDRNYCQQEVDNFTSRLTEKEQKRLETLRKITELEAKVKQLTSMTQTYHNDIYQASGDIEKKEEELLLKKRELDDLSNKIRSNEHQITSLRGERGNPLAIYGRNTIKLVEEIKAASGYFSELPRGPLGSYISVKDKNWAIALESIINRGMLHAFYVSTPGDADILLGLMKKVYVNESKPTIITCKFSHKVYDVSGNLVTTPEGCKSAFEAITVSDPVVMNCLIDQLGIENILLIPTVNQAMEMMSEKENVPYKCHTALTMDGDQFYPDPNYRMYSSTKKRAQYLEVDTSDVLGQCEESIKDYRSQREKIEAQYRTLKAEINNRKVGLNEITANQERAGASIRKTRENIANLRLNEEMETGNVYQLECELKDISKSIDDKNTAIVHLDEGLEQIREEIVEEQANLEKLIAVNGSFEERSLPLEEELNNQAAKKQDILTNNDCDKRRLSENKRNIEVTTSQVTNIERTLQLEYQQAEYLGQKVDNPRPVQVLGIKVKELQSQIRKTEVLNEDVDILVANYERKLNIYIKNNDIMERISNNLTKLEYAFNRRKRLYKYSRDYIVRFVGHCFTTFLKTRQFEGSIDIDFDEKTLDLTVVPQQGSQGVTVTTNLSGGERSFSTVAFLYSLWQCLDFPFYFLDEFDVFMDKFNRTKVMEMLIYHAKNHPTTQFVFLTPQDISFIKDDDVGIHRLEDPERTQSQG